VRPRWESGPSTLTVVRHAHSTGNRANALARRTGVEAIDLGGRDVDVGLSTMGRAQVDALAGWVHHERGLFRPSVLLSSPYRRTAETASGVADALGLEVEYDERLRERDAGILTGLTPHGIRERHPEELRRRDEVGEFFYQPPTGESWCDLTLRVRSFLHDLRTGYDGARVWVFTHQAVVIAFRYVLEGLSPERMLQIDRDLPLPNASQTSYRRAGPLLQLVRYADTGPLGDLEVTDETSTGEADS
jgi:broad specificity phosphatase PhoE